jgi:hypothetical protein
MSSTIVVEPNGLQLERSRIVGGQPGLTRAENVKSSRPGLIEPRGSFAHSGIEDPFSSPTDTLYTVHARRWNGVVYSIGTTVDADGVPTANGSALLAGRDQISGSAVVPWTGSTTSTYANQQARTQDLGDRLLWALDDGVFALDANQTMRRAGAPRAAVPYCTLQTSAATIPAGQNWLVNDRATAYRVVFVYTRNGVPMFGAPSDRVVVRNLTGTAKYVRVKVQIGELLDADSVEVQIYRSPEVATPYTGTPSDEMRLRYSVQLTAATATSSFEFDDFLDDDAWSGATIYTAETQQGAAQANYRPAFARDIETYNGMTFYAGHQSAQVIQATVTALGPTSNPQESLCSVVFNATATSGVTTLTAVTADCFPYFAVGQLVTGFDFDGAGGGYASIVSFDSGALTVELDTAPQATATADVFAWDWIGVVDAQGVLRRVLAQWYDVASLAYAPPFFIGNYIPGTPGNAPYTDADFGFFACTDVVTGANTQSGGGFDIDRAWAWTYPEVDVGVPTDYAQIRCYSTSTSFGAQRYVILRWETFGDAPSSSGFELRCTKPAALDVAATTTSGVASYQEGGPSIVYVSKVDEPEALPLVNTFPIGAIDQAIVGVMATTDSLWILKTDGLWRMYGDSPDQLVVQQVDPTCRGLDIAGARRWMQRVGDVIYAWTTMGIVAISSSGVRRVDGPIQTEIQKYTPTRGQNVEFPSSIGSVVEQVVGFGFKSHTISADPLWFVLSTESGQWQTWTFRADAVDAPAIMVPLGDGASPDGRGLCGTGCAGWADYLEDPRSADDATPDAYPIAISDYVTTGGGFTQPTITAVTGQWVDYDEGTGLGAFEPGDMIVDFDGVPFWFIEPEPDPLYVDGMDTPVIVNGEVVTVALGEAKLDREGAVTGLATTHRWAMPSVITYAMHTEGVPIVDKFYRQVYTHAQTIRGGVRMQTGVRAYNSTVTTVTESVYSAPDYLDNPREYLRRVDVPREQTRAVGVAVTVTYPDAAQSFELGAAATTYEPTGDRTASPYV